MWIQDFLSRKALWPLRHGLFWLIMYFDEFMSFFGYSLPIDDHFAFFVGLALDMIMVYLNLYVLIPWLFTKQKYLLYIVLTMAMIIGNVLILFYAFPMDDLENPLSEFLFPSSLVTAGLLGIAIALKLAKIAFERQERLNKLQQLQLEGELNTLKRQVNPHFLFNTLNGIYVLSRERPDLVPDVILKLADLMRYTTYDSSKEFIRMDKEIDFIREYLELEKLRRDNMEYKINVAGDLSQVKIPPLLLLPLVENACKYSQSANGEEEKIILDCTLENSHLSLRLENNIGRRDDYMHDNEYSGIGLENSQRRLKLLYPKTHQLNFDDQGDRYIVSLEIQKIATNEIT